MRTNERPSVLITDAATGSAVATVRSLGRRGWRVIAADADARSPGLQSRYVTERLVYPHPLAKPSDTVAALQRAARERRVQLMIPVTDAVILPLSEARDQFAGICQLALPEPGALACVTDKQRTLQLAQQVGVPTPRSALVENSREALRAGQSLGWPVVLKPVVSRLYRACLPTEVLVVKYADSPARLLEQMRHFEGRCAVLLQEYCPGIGYGVELLLDHGRALAAFQHRRLREVPLSGGSSAFRESTALDALLYGYAVRLLESLSWTGLAMVEFRVGPSGPRLMEVNGRMWGSLPLAVRCGMDFPARLAELYLNGPPRNGPLPDTRYAVGVRARDLSLDVVWIASVLSGRGSYPYLPRPRRREAVLALLGMLNPTYKFDIVSLEDPCPGVAEVGALVGKVRARLRASV
ncbi:MAG TPA: ATP-grasp domain-containing protein [Chloroflexota bacterium]|jgi:predicted ATP-grasp superfamily ATP-dependent carboligase|nr:ATP-grasp domain-containing protein [Chloroflexota bacterium]